MNNEFENIVPWNGANDTGRDVRLKWQRNFERVKANFEEILKIVGDAELAKKFLRKDQKDETNYLISFLAGAIFGEHGFAPGLTGFGARIDGKGYGEMRGLTLWEWLMVPEIRYNRVEIVIGDKWRGPGGGIIETCTPDTDEEGNLLNTGTCTLKLEDGEFGAVEVGDMNMGIFHFGDSRDATENSDDGKGNFTYAGFATAYWLIKEVSGDNNGTFRYSLRDGYNIHPCPQMHFSCRGNVDKADRQTSVYETRTYTRMLWKQNTWEISKANIAMQYGDLSNLKIFGLDMTGYSIYLNSVYFTGTIMQVKPDGTPIRTANDRGAWPPADNHADYFDRFSYLGCIWLCVAENGTDTPPSADSAAWLKQVDKGDDGASMTNMGGWHTELLVPYLGIVRMYDATWMTSVKEGTKNPPLWCWTDKDGNRFTFSDGGYALTGEENTAEYQLVARDGKKGVDGVGIPGEDGKTLYTWIRYADDEQGNGISDNPTGKNYIGIANNKETPLESNNPADYTWSYIKGEPGIGIPGDDGKTLYTWIAYSDNADGSGMYQVPKDSTKYIGIAPNKETATESNNPTDYVWSKFRGEDGRGITKIENFYLATSLSSGVTTSTPGWTTSVQAVSAANKYLWNYEKITYTDTMTTSTQPAILGQYSADGKGIASIQEEYGISASQSAKPSSWQSTTPAIDSTNKYLWNRETTTYTDGSTRTTEHVIAVYGDQGDSVTNMGGWHTELLVPYLGIVRMYDATWMTSVKEGTKNPPLWCWTDKDGNRFTFSDGGYALTGEENTAEYQLVARDGKKGVDGVGIPGEDGKTLYTWIRYADDEQGNGISDNPTGKNYIGIANNKETPLESNNPADYTWSYIKGEPGIGIPGDDGKTLYTWIAYSDNADGSGMYQVPKDSTKYIGIAPNKETATESNNPTDYVWSKFRGEDGRGITKIENFYLATSLSSGVTTSTPGWTTSVQAVSAANKYLWNYEKITYTDTMTTSTQPAILGQYSADGKGIASIQEEYGISASQSAKPSSWQSTTPAIDSTNKYLWNRETTTYTDGSTRTTEHVIAVYGDQGDSVTNLGQWNTGLHVPYLGIVRMGTSSWMCSTKSGTNSPPLWCWTDKDGNRFTFSDGGYVLTGGENTAEYQLVATDGKNGEDGESIKGEDGLSGCTIRRAVWKAGVEWRNDADKATQPRYEDTALIKDDAVSTGWRAYQCLVTHTSSEANKPGTSGGSSYWREYSLNTPDFFTNFILANGASIDLMQSNQVVVYTPEYVAEAGLTGKGIGSNADVRIFGGPISGNEAPFMVMSNGSLVATKATITGKIYATEGWFRGNIETSESGKRIVISPTDNSLRMIDASNKELLKMWFSNLDGESYDSSRILMDKYIGGAKNAETDIMPGNISLVSIAGNMLTTLTSGGIILTNTANGNSITLQPEKTILFTSSGSYNGRTAYFNVSGIGGLRFINGLLVE